MQLDTPVSPDINQEISQPMQEAPQGWGESIKNWFGSLSEKFQESIATKEILFETLIYFTIGAAVGFLAKKYLKHLLIAVVLLVVIIKGMEMANIGTMNVNWDHVKELTGLSPEDSVTSVTSMIFAWIQVHIRQSIAFVIGMFIGSKIG